MASGKIALAPEQRRVALGMAGGALCSALVLGVGMWLFPLPLPPLDGMAERLAFALRADLLVLIWLAAAIGNVARKRFFSPADIQGSGFSDPSAALAVDVAIVQNTLEQTVLALGAHLALASVLRGSEMALIPLLVGLFCLGRASFWFGYRGGAGSRAFGFATTFYPTLFAYGVGLFCLTTRH
ncbi:MAG: MAPEG family protein [Azospirillum sp.]|nr:MAPEG family protein [Azospirillum sp.]